MSSANPIEQMYPALLENSLREVGDLIGEPLELADGAFCRGPLEEVFPPPKKMAVAAGFRVKGEDVDRVHLIMDLDVAIELAGRLIMLPADEIRASQKQATLDGELEDAFSEIANIITGVINSTWQEVVREKKRHFVKGDIAVFGPKDTGPPLPDENQSVFSGKPVRKDASLSQFSFFFPDSLASEPKEAQKDQEDKQPAPAPEISQPGIPEPVTAAAAPDAVQSEPAPAATTSQAVDALLAEGLGPAAEELEAFLGDKVSFVDPQSGHRKKADLLSRTRGKQVLTRIRATGDKEGRALMLLPLKDAIYFGGLLLMMPAESITQVVKQGKFEGEVADAFGEIANILVSSYSSQFKAGLPFTLKLQKDRVETLVPAQVEPDADEPFSASHYYLISARIQVADNTYGPLELLFPVELLGLANPDAAADPAQPDAAAPARPLQKDDKQPAGGQKTGPGQKSDMDAEAGGEADISRSESPSRIISIIGGDSGQLQVVEECIAQEDVALARHSMDSDFKQAFDQATPDCVFLFISRVNDQGLAKAIKVRAALRKNCPLIVAGPQWTRSLVLKARKYGASDILVTPADKDVILKKYRKYL